MAFRWTGALHFVASIFFSSAIRKNAYCLQEINAKMAVRRLQQCQSIEVVESRQCSGVGESASVGRVPLMSSPIKPRPNLRCPSSPLLRSSPIASSDSQGCAADYPSCHTRRGSRCTLPLHRLLTYRTDHAYSSPSSFVTCAGRRVIHTAPPMALPTTYYSGAHNIVQGPARVRCGRHAGRSRRKQ